MRTESEVRKRLAELEEQRDGQDPEAGREIDRLKWVLEIGPDHIRVPNPQTEKR